jgi:hypothetical protein
VPSKHKAAGSNPAGRTVGLELRIGPSTAQLGSDEELRGEHSAQTAGNWQTGDDCRGAALNRPGPVQASSNPVRFGAVVEVAEDGEGGSASFESLRPRRTSDEPQHRVQPSGALRWSVRREEQDRHTHAHGAAVTHRIVADHQRCPGADTKLRASEPEQLRVRLCPSVLAGQHECGDETSNAVTFEGRPDVPPGVAQHGNGDAPCAQRLEHSGSVGVGPPSAGLLQPLVQ